MRRTPRAPLLAAGLALALAPTGCFNPPDVDEGLYCDGEHDNACPEGQACGIDNICHWETEDPCDLPYTCPNPSPGNVSICGQLYDTATGNEIRDDGADATACDPSDPASSGPCALGIRFYYASDYFDDPDTASQLQPGSIGYDTCGRVLAVDVPRPVDGWIAFQVDDAPGAGGDTYVRTATTFELEGGEIESDATLVATRKATDQAWTASVGASINANGNTFSEAGASLNVFLYHYEPLDGVQVTFEDAAVGAGDAFYFSDSEPTARETVDATATGTGSNGSVLVINRSLGMFGGTGGISSDACVWEKYRSAAVPGVIHYVEHLAIRSDDPTGDCP